MQHFDQIISARWIITVNPENEVLAHHALAITKGKIGGLYPNSAIGKTITADQITDLSKTHALMPGFVNAHTHAAMNLLRGLADDLNLMDWLQHHIWPAEAKVVSPEFVRDGMLHACAEMLRGGTTCFNDNYFFVDTAAPLVEEIGMRAVLAEALFNFPVPWSANYEQGIERARNTHAQYRHSDLIKIALAPHAPYTTDIALLQKIKTLSDAENMLMHVHMHEGKNEISDYQVQHKLRPLQHYQKENLLSKRWLNIHMCDCNTEDVAILKQYDLSIVHCPESNMKLASGICPVNTLLKSGINVALGTDGAASNNDLDMMGEMRSACFLAKVTTGDPTAVSAVDALRMATINGAKALGLAQTIGSLEAEKYADITAIDLSSIETQPLFHPIAQVVYASSRKDISHVWVNGKALLQDYELTTIKLQEVTEKIQYWQERIRSYA